MVVFAPLIFILFFVWVFVDESDEFWLKIKLFSFSYRFWPSVCWIGFLDNLTKNASILVFDGNWNQNLKWLRDCDNVKCSFSPFANTWCSARDVIISVFCVVSLSCIIQILEDSKYLFLQFVNERQEGVYQFVSHSA